MQYWRGRARESGQFLTRQGSMAAASAPSNHRDGPIIAPSSIAVQDRIYRPSPSALASRPLGWRDGRPFLLRETRWTGSQRHPHALRTDNENPATPGSLGGRPVPRAGRRIVQYCRGPKGHPEMSVLQDATHGRGLADRRATTPHRRARTWFGRVRSQSLVGNPGVTIQRKEEGKLMPEGKAGG